MKFIKILILLLLTLENIPLHANIIHNTYIKTGKKQDDIKPIQNINVNDYVYGVKLTKTGYLRKIGNLKVRKIETAYTAKFIKIITNKGILTIGQNEYIYISNKRKFVKSKYLVPGDTLLYDNLTSCKIIKTEKYTLNNPILTYKISVNSPHLFFILDDNGNSFLIHNMNPIFLALGYGAKAIPAIGKGIMAAGAMIFGSKVIDKNREASREHLPPEVYMHPKNGTKYKDKRDALKAADNENMPREDRREMYKQLGYSKKKICHKLNEIYDDGIERKITLRPPKIKDNVLIDPITKEFFPVMFPGDYDPRDFNMEPERFIPPVIDYEIEKILIERPRMHIYISKRNLEDFIDDSEPYKKSNKSHIYIRKGDKVDAYRDVRRLSISKLRRIDRNGKTVFVGKRGDKTLIARSDSTDRRADATLEVQSTYGPKIKIRYYPK